MRPPTTPWYPFGRGYQSTIRAPYMDLEVQPDGDGWLWRVLSMDPSSGGFSELARGHCPTLVEAKAKAIHLATTTSER